MTAAVLLALAWVVVGDGDREPTLGGPSVPDGRTIARLMDVDVGDETVTIDPVRWLTGDEAAAAWRRDYPGDEAGPPNDFYVANDDRRRTKLAVRSDVDVRLVRLAEDGDADTDPATLEELATYGRDPQGGWPGSGLYWFTLEGGVVVAVEEQYVP